MGEARVRPALVILAAALPLLAGCLVPDAPFDTPARATTLAGSPSSPPRQVTGAMSPTGPVYSVPHSAPPGPGEGQPSAMPGAATAGASASGPASASGGAAGDTCGAADLAYLVGKSRTEIPVPADLSHRQVVCTTCPAAPDVRPERLTITFDSATKLVTKVACG